jgi:predicted DNA binding CopG/RHH family protein
MNRLPERIPKFQTEVEEADWWFANRDKLAGEFKYAAKHGLLKRGTVTQRGNTPTTTIRLDPADIERAKLAAEKRGIKYQTYLKMLIHTALNEEPVGMNAKRGQAVQRSVVRAHSAGKR